MAVNDKESRRQLVLFDVPVHDVSFSEAIQSLTGMALGNSPHHVVTVNPEFVILAQKNGEFRRVLQQASLAVPDGMGIIWASKMLRLPIKERVTGVDIVYGLASALAQKRSSIFLLGAMPGVAERVASILRERNPGLRIAGSFAGSPSADEEDKICSMIEAAAPQVLLVAYGPPRQDLWIARTQNRLRVPLALGVGGTFDFIAGVAIRAPIWMQRAGLEWVYRLMKEPRRWRRMLTLPQFGLLVVFQALFGEGATRRLVPKIYPSGGSRTRERGGLPVAEGVEGSSDWQTKANG